MPDFQELIKILEEIRRLVDSPTNDFMYSGWSDRYEALVEIDGAILQLKNGDANGAANLLFLPTGPLQEVSVNSDWGNRFCELADRFDRAKSSS